MELRNGKKYFFKTKPKKKIPKYIQNFVDYLSQDFIGTGYELILEDYCTINTKKDQDSNLKKLL